MLNFMKTTGLAALGAVLAFPAFAQETVGDAATEAVAEAVAATVDKGDTAWMMVATILVLGMTVPGSPSSTAGWCAPRTCCRS